ncbi:hypothetical protein GCM10009678_68500 [Actinomadura kijaniata]|uniref:Uncharacterized protein n=1 Tax=Actinomadura namibiensis TaxID=182080 RepID=A0A7W3LYZ5_ACTNM|nr:hypothetical protein [Actinomadura namibiensis]
MATLLFGEMAAGGERFMIWDVDSANESPGRGRARTRGWRDVRLVIYIVKAGGF